MLEVRQQTRSTSDLTRHQSVTSVTLFAFEEGDRTSVQALWSKSYLRWQQSCLCPESHLSPLHWCRKAYLEGWLLEPMLQCSLSSGEPTASLSKQQLSRAKVVKQNSFHCTPTKTVYLARRAALMFHLQAMYCSHACSAMAFMITDESSKHPWQKARTSGHSSPTAGPNRIEVRERSSQ